MDYSIVRPRLHAFATPVSCFFVRFRATGPSMGNSVYEMLIIKAKGGGASLCRRTCSAFAPSVTGVERSKAPLLSRASPNSVFTQRWTAVDSTNHPSQPGSVIASRDYAFRAPSRVGSRRVTWYSHAIGVASTALRPHAVHREVERNVMHAASGLVWGGRTEERPGALGAHYDGRPVLGTTGVVVVFRLRSVSRRKMGERPPRC